VFKLPKSVKATEKRIEKIDNLLE